MRIRLPTMSEPENVCADSRNFIAWIHFIAFIVLAAQYSILIVGPLYRIHLKEIESLKEDNMFLPEKQAIEA